MMFNSKLFELFLYFSWGRIPCYTKYFVIIGASFFGLLLLLSLATTASKMLLLPSLTTAHVMLKSELCTDLLEDWLIDGVEQEQ
jgi:hypothetical protein|tara:strand:- start:145 stop:396 length:252 start_codon:yes stop_codon:yes gene_type:complete